MSTALLIANPSSGKADAEEEVSAVSKFLEEHFDEVTTQLSTSAEHAMKLAREARTSGVDAVFSLGGDGTVSLVVRGLLDSAADSDELPVLGILPGGTGNGFARTLGIPSDVTSTLEAMDFTSTRPIDIGTVNGTPFTYTVTGGSLPEGIRDVSSEDKSRFGFLAYVTSELQRIGGDESYRLRITVDGKRSVEDVNSFVAFSVNTMVNMVTTEESSTESDGLIHLAVLKEATLPSLMSLLPNILTRTAEESDQVLLLSGKHIRIECLDGSLCCGRDGDDGPELPIDLSILPQRVKIFALKG